MRVMREKGRKDQRIIMTAQACSLSRARALSLSLCVCVCVCGLTRRGVPSGDRRPPRVQLSLLSHLTYIPLRQLDTQVCKAPHGVKSGCAQEEQEQEQEGYIHS